MESLSLVIPRPLRDIYSQNRELGESDNLLIVYTHLEKRFIATTIERLLIAGAAAGVLRYTQAPKWATYGATAVISLPATMALLAGDLIYRGLSSVALTPGQLGMSALMVGGGILLFENYDRICLTRNWKITVHLNRETLIRRYIEWSDRWAPDIHLSQGNDESEDDVSSVPSQDDDSSVQSEGETQKLSFLSPGVWGQGLGEPVLDKINTWLFPGPKFEPL
jgi:hypothetical protein